MGIASGARSSAKVLAASALIAAAFALTGCGGGGGGGFFPLASQEPAPAGSPPSQHAGLPAPSGGPGGVPANLRVSYSPKTFSFSWDAVDGAIYYQLLEDPDGAGPAGAAPVGGRLGATSYAHTVALHRRLNASYTVQACDKTGCGAGSTPLAPELVKAIGYFKSSNTQAEDRFAESLALSADGNTLAVGAISEDSGATGINGNQGDNSASAAGAVYVYARTGGVWTQQAYVKASNAQADDTFGTAVALSADGNTLAVGATGEDSGAVGVGQDQSSNAAPLSGGVYVFARTGTTWAQEAYVKASNTQAGDFFGSSVALSADGNTMAVGASGEDSNATGIGGSQTDENSPAAGAVYVFQRGAGTWAQQAYVKPSDRVFEDRFGERLALSGDGNTLVVGTMREWVFVFARAGEIWAEQASLVASNSKQSDYFGGALSLSADGNTLAVGAQGEDSNATGVGGDQADNSLTNAGAVYVFGRSGTSWTQRAYVKGSNQGDTSEFGTSVALSADGRTLAVGAGGDSSDAFGVSSDRVGDSSQQASGAVYVFTLTGDTWARQAFLKPINTSAGSYFGRYVALSADGSTLAAAAIGEDSNATGIGGDPNGGVDDSSGYYSGAVYLY